MTMKDGMQVDKWKKNVGENGMAKRPVQVCKKQRTPRKYATGKPDSRELEMNPVTSDRWEPLKNVEGAPISQ